MWNKVDASVDFNQQQIKYYYKIKYINSEENSWWRKARRKFVVFLLQFQLSILIIIFTLGDWSKTILKSFMTMLLLKILPLFKVQSLQLGFRYLVFGIQFEYDQYSNFLKILGLQDKLFKTQLRTLVRTNIVSKMLKVPSVSKSRLKW